MTLRFKVGAVIITYNPSFDLMDNVQLLEDQVDHIVIVDNSIESEVIDLLLSSPRERITIVRNGKNDGIAAAANRGCSLLASRGFQWALTMDQDSKPTENLVAALVAAVRASGSPEKVAVVGSRQLHPKYSEQVIPWLKRSRFPLLFHRERPDEGLACQAVDVVITSGCLTNLDVWDRVGQFREEFFIDYVDTEYCLRALRSGYKVLACSRARLVHELGSRKRCGIAPYALSPTNHSSLRRYYIARNSVPMIREYGLSFPHWLLFDICAASVNAVRILAFESDRREKVTMSLRGFRDGLLGKMGAFPDKYSRPV